MNWIKDFDGNGTMTQEDVVEGLAQMARLAGLPREKVEIVRRRPQESRGGRRQLAGRPDALQRGHRRRPSSSTERPMSARSAFDDLEASHRPAGRRMICRRAGVEDAHTLKFSRLRLSGFKSFVDPTELLIEPGLDRRRRPERLRQIQSAGGVALGDGRKPPDLDARLGHGRRDLRAAPAAGRCAITPK